MYFLKRIIFAIPLLLVISALAFALVHLAPGGPFDRERAPASPEIERALKAKYHLDEPVWKQYFRYLGDLAHGDFGVSLKYRNHTVNDIIAQGLPVSMLLGALAFGFAMGVGLPVGFFTAARRGRWPDYAGSFLATLAVCVPGFVVAPLLILFFSIKWKLLPVGLWETPWHMILPPIALGLFFAGKVARLVPRRDVERHAIRVHHRGARQGTGRNPAVAPARLPHRRAAGRFLFRPDAGRPADRLVCHREHFPDSRHRRLSRQQLVEPRLHPRRGPFAALCGVAHRAESDGGFRLHPARPAREI